jgi:hypothetical protein
LKSDIVFKLDFFLTFHLFYSKICQNIYTHKKSSTLQTLHKLSVDIFHLNRCDLVGIINCNIFHLNIFNLFSNKILKINSYKSVLFWKSWIPKNLNFLHELITLTNEKQYTHHRRHFKVKELFEDSWIETSRTLVNIGG